MPRAEIATKQAKFTLDTLHAELAGKVAANKEEGERLLEAMRHVEAVLKLLDPGYSLRKISIRRRKPNVYFKRGTIFRAALDVLREADKPLTSAEVALRMFAAQGVSPDRQAARDLEGGVRAALKARAGDTVRAIGNSPVRWQIALTADRA